MMLISFDVNAISERITVVRIQSLLRGWVCASLMIVLTACAQSSETAKEKASTVGSVVGYNHTPAYIHQFYVNDSGGGNIRAYGGGGLGQCCIYYPRQWRHDLTVEVRWTTSSADPNAKGDDAIEKWHTTTVPIEPYTASGRVNVHFLSDGKVKVVISAKGARNPEYPGPAYPVAPPDFKFKF